MVLRPADRTGPVRQASARGNHQNCFAPQPRAEIHVFSIRNSLEILIEAMPTNRFRPKTHQGARESSDPDWFSFTKTVCLPIDWLPLIVEWPSNEHRGPQPIRPARTPVIRNDPRNARDTWMLVINRQQLFQKVRFKNHIIVQEEPNISFGNLHGAISRTRETQDRGIAEIAKLGFSSRRKRSFCKQPFEPLLTFVAVALIDNDDLSWENALPENALYSNLEV